VLVDADRRHPDRVARLEAIIEEAASVDAQVIAVCQHDWTDPPEGAEVFVFPSEGLGDRYDAASASARGRLLAFLDSRVVMRPGWAGEVLQAFEDPTLMVAGGPVIPIGERLDERVSALVMTQYLGNTPVAHNARPTESKEVREVGSSNLVIRANSFRAVGGFQAPVRGQGEAVRLCYKVRTLLEGKIMAQPGLALSAVAPGFPGPLLRNIGSYGRARGNLARRLPEAAPLFPYALPTLASLAAVISLILIAVVGSGILRWSLAAALVLALGTYIGLSVRRVRGAGPLADRILAGVALPAVLFVYGATFLRGYFGRSLDNITPPRHRDTPPRVLILNWRDVTHPASGGAETYMHQIGRRWVAEGMTVGWLTQHHAGSRRSDVIDGIRIHRIGGRATQYPFAALAYLFRLRRHYDVIVDCENGIPFFTPFYSRKPRVLVVHHVHQEIFRTQLPRQISWFALWLEGSLMPRAYRHSQVVAVSQGTRSELIELGFDPERVSVITNGVSPSIAVSSTPTSYPSILCMGRLAPQKSVDVLIRSMTKIVEEIPEVHLDIIGQGPDRVRLERLAWAEGLAGSVRFHGYVAAEVRDKIAGQAWISVCPSSYEGWGVVCMEASARGLPVVASNVAGLRESVRDGETGILFPYGDTEALATAILKLARDPQLRATMGEAGKEWAARHTWESSAATFSSLIDSLLHPDSVTVKSDGQLAFAEWQ
jgi:glycosyltransferase involved in cell wall biosynthesis